MIFLCSWSFHNKLGFQCFDQFDKKATREGEKNTFSKGRLQHIALCPSLKIQIQNLLI